MSDIQAIIAVSKAVHAKLRDDEGVQSVLGHPPRLYDNPPEDPVFPYLTYGPMRSQDISGDGAVINNHTMTLHIWSRYGGRAQVMEALEVVTKALERGVLDVADISLVRSQVSYTDIFRAPDGLTLHGLIRFSLMTDQEPTPEQGVS